MNWTLTSLLGGRASTVVASALLAAMMVFAVLSDASAHSDFVFASEGHSHVAAADEHHGGDASGVVHCHASASCAATALGVEVAVIDGRTASTISPHADVQASGLNVSPDDPPPIH